MQDSVNFKVPCYIRGLGSQPGEGCAAKPGPAPTDLEFTRDRINSAQVGQSRLAMARASG